MTTSPSGTSQETVAEFAFSCVTVTLTGDGGLSGTDQGKAQERSKRRRLRTGTRPCTPPWGASPTSAHGSTLARAIGSSFSGESVPRREVAQQVHKAEPCQQQHMHGMVLTGLVGSCPLCVWEVCRHRATPCLCSYPSVAPAGFGSLHPLARTPPCLAVVEKCAYCTPHPLQCPTVGKEDKLTRHLTGSSLKGLLAVADIAHCS